MDNPTPNEVTLKTYRFPFQVEGIRTFMPMYHNSKGATVEEAAHNAVEELTAIWTKKLGGEIKTASQARVAVLFKSDADKAPEFIPDYQI